LNAVEAPRKKKKRQKRRKEKEPQRSVLRLDFPI
jgi:hypothetical protein